MLKFKVKTKTVALPAMALEEYLRRTIPEDTLSDGWVGGGPHDFWLDNFWIFCFNPGLLITPFRFLFPNVKTKA